MMNTTEPDDHETRADWTLEGVQREPNFDAPMKAQVTDDLETEVQA